MSHERIIALDGGRFGILTEPVAPDPARATVVLFNVGLVHRAGPFRQQVQLARHLAGLGHPVLRYDMPGIGDSAYSSTPATAIVGAIFDRLGALLGSRAFIVGGICAAADLGWNVARADARVAGLLLIDGVARPGPWFRIGQSKLFLARPASSWAGMVMRRLGTKAEPGEEHFRDWPEPGNEPAELAGLVERGVRVLALYTGGIAHYFLHPRQFEATFGAAAGHGNVEFEFWPDCDHLVMAREDRRRLQRRIGDWCGKVKPL